MDTLKRFREHPASVGEAYVEHARHATSFGWSMLKGACACYVHAAFPWMHLKSGSQTVIRLHNRMVINRARARLDEMSPPDPSDYLAEHI